MKRRTFVKTAAGAGLAAAASFQQSLADHHLGGHGPQTLEWLKYVIETTEQRAIVDRFLKNAAIPGLNRLGSKPIGVFYDQDNPADQSVYMLTPFSSMEAFTSAPLALGGDDDFMAQASEYLNTAKNQPGYQRIESTLMSAFSGFPQVKSPLSGERIFELRVYESHNELKGHLKVEMFNEAELDIFDKVGLQGVFYGQSLVGSNLPNLTYMLAYKDMDARKAAWGRFSKHPDWQVLKANERYKDTVSKIVAKYFVPAPYSQI